MLDLFGLGQIGTTLTFIAAGIGAVWGAIWKAKRDGAREATAKRTAQDAKEYQDERKKIDAEIGAVGSTDADRIAVLRGIAKRRGAGAD